MAGRVFSQKASRHLNQLQNLGSWNDFQQKKKNGGAQTSFFEAFDKKLSGWNDFSPKRSLAWKETWVPSAIRAAGAAVSGRTAGWECSGRNQLAQAAANIPPHSSRQKDASKRGAGRMELMYEKSGDWGKASAQALEAFRHDFRICTVLINLSRKLRVLRDAFFTWF